MSAHPLRKKATAALGVILLGAIGSGVWVGMLGPVLVYVRDGILNLAGGGFETFRNSTYQKVALGLHEDAAVQVWLAISMFMMFPPLIAVTYLKGRLRRLHHKLQPNAPMSVSSKWFLKFAGERPNLKGVNRLRWALNAYWLIILFAMSVNIVMGVRTQFVNGAVTHYLQLRSELLPVLDNETVKRYDSRFAQVAQKSDYVSLISELEALAKQNHFAVRRFSPW